MPAEIRKIRPDIESTPEMIIGMLASHGKKIKNIAAVVFWDDDSVQFVNNSMSLRDEAYALAIFQRQLMEDLNYEESKS